MRRIGRIPIPIKHTMSDDTQSNPFSVTDQASTCISYNHCCLNSHDLLTHREIQKLDIILVGVRVVLWVDQFVAHAYCDSTAVSSCGASSNGQTNQIPVQNNRGICITLCTRRYEFKA